MVAGYPETRRPPAAEVAGRENRCGFGGAETKVVVGGQEQPCVGLGQAEQVGREPRVLIVLAAAFMTHP